jgi:hypothetical protein
VQANIDDKRPLWFVKTGEDKKIMGLTIQAPRLIGLQKLRFQRLLDPKCESC